MLHPEKKKKIPARRYRRMIFALILLATLVAGLTVVITQRLMRPPQIVYVDNFVPLEGNASYEVMVINTDGSGSPLNVSNHPMMDFDAEWLPDGSAIAFNSGRNRRADGMREIHVVNPDGSNLRTLAPIPGGGYDKRYAPDGMHIAFTLYQDELSDIALVDSDGLNQVNLTNSQTGTAGEDDPVWSPDGAQLAFVCGRSLCTINADGTNRETLKAATKVSNPLWSPEGSHIAFQCGRDNLCVIGADGSGLKTVADNYYAVYNNFDWSPDGTRLVFVVEETPENAEIYVVNVDGSNPVNISKNPMDDWYPAWSPDGSQIAFASFRDSADNDYRSEIYTISPDGTNLHRLTYSDSHKAYPRWRPNPCGAWDIVCNFTRP